MRAVSFSVQSITNIRTAVHCYLVVSLEAAPVEKETVLD